jgi:hypothetical protein
VGRPYLDAVKVRAQAPEAAADSIRFGEAQVVLACPPALARSTAGTGWAIVVVCARTPAGIAALPVLDPLALASVSPNGSKAAVGFSMEGDEQRVGALGPLPPQLSISTAADPLGLGLGAVAAGLRDLLWLSGCKGAGLSANDAPDAADLLVTSHRWGGAHPWIRACEAVAVWVDSSKPGSQERAPSPAAPLRGLASRLGVRPLFHVPLGVWAAAELRGLRVRTDGTAVLENAWFAPA